MSNLQHLTEKERSWFALLWPVTLLNNDVRVCQDKPDKVPIRLLLSPLFKGVICLMMDPENTQGNHMPSAG